MDDVILYDIKRYTTWVNEIDLNKDSGALIKQKNVQSNYYYISKIGAFLKSLIRFRNDETTLKLILTTLKPWNHCKLSISRSGLLAVLQDNFIEVYSDSDSFTEYLWRKEVKTTCSQLCCISWNESSTLLVFVNESSSYIIFDENGKELSQYTEKESVDFENSLNKIEFLNGKVAQDMNIDDAMEILVSVSYVGYIFIYAINKELKLTKLSSIPLLSIFPNGVYCSEIDNDKNYLIVGSYSKDSYSKKTTTISKHGISVWRFINTKPWLKNAFLTDTVDEMNNKAKSYDKSECVIRMSISPDNSTIAAVYNNGKIALYSMPNLKLMNSWDLSEQAVYDEIENPYEAKMFKKIYTNVDTKANDIGWWNEKVLIITRGSGILALCSTNDFSDLMGQNQEWLSPYSRLYTYPKNGFLVLDCACTLLSQSSSTETDDAESDSETLNDDFDEDKWYSSLAQLTKAKLYNLSGIQRLKPLEKKPKFLKRKFRLLHFKSTTPEELFQSKLNAEEYGEALQLARTYDLDTDLVYQKQWRSKPMTRSTIIDYLSKIKKRSWILHECLERVPFQIDSAKYLIDFGLHGTDIDALVAIQDKDDNKFLYCKNAIPEDVDDFEQIDRFNPKQLKEQSEKLKKFKMDKLKLLDVDNLNLMQKELCSIRIRLLTYLDRLTVYEQILGGKSLAPERFDAETFYKIRSQSVLDMAIDFAREGNSKAVQIIISYYQSELKDKHLDILSNFSETQDPYQYELLLPVIKDAQVEIFNEEEYLRDEQDWVDSEKIRTVLEFDRRETKDESREKDSVLLTSEVVRKWYETRIYEIEELSGFVDNSLKLCELAIRNGCKKNFTKLYDNLLTLSTLIYDCKTDNKVVTLKYIQKLNELEQVKLIMSNYEGDLTNELYAKRLQDWLLPYIERRSGNMEREKLLKEYLVFKSKQELDTCLKVIQLKQKLIHQLQLQQQQQQQAQQKVKKSFVSETAVEPSLLVLKDIDLVDISVGCLYNNEKNDQLDICRKIIENLRRFSNDAKILEIENHLKCCEIYHKYNVTGIKLKNLNESIENEDICRQLITQIAQNAFKNRVSEEYLNELEKTVQYLHANLYKNLFSYQNFKEILIRNLLNSKSMDNIKLASKKLDDLFQIDVNLSMKLCVESSQLYFNSSTSYHDSDMRLAQECLTIVDLNLKRKYYKQNESSSENSGSGGLKYKHLFNQEVDLIAAVKLINEMHITNLLPVKIRTMPNRFDIIKLVLDKSPNAFKDHEKLISLGKLLELNKINKNCEDIMLLICEHALAKSNLQIALLMCNNMIKLSFKDSWKCAKELAISLINTKTPLSSSMSTTQNLLSSIKRFSTNIYNLNDFGGESATEGANSEIYLNEIAKLLSFSLAYCDNESLDEILSLQIGISNKLTSHSFNYYRNLSDEAEQEETKLDLSDIEVNCTFDDGYSNNDKITYLLYELVKYDKNNEDLQLTNQHFLKMLQSLLIIDVNLVVSYLLQLKERNEIFYIELVVNSVQNNNDLTYEFLLYILTLTILGKLKPNFGAGSLKSDLYNVNFDNLLEITRKLRDQDENADENLSKLFSLFTKVDNLYTEYRQLNELSSLHRGINVDRFKNEYNYKTDTIYGLAMDINTFDLACNLAKLNSLNLWDIYIVFIEYLFNEYDDGTGDEAAKMKLLDEYVDKLKPELTKDKDKLVDRFNKSVLPLIEGTNIDKLIRYFSLLSVNEDVYEIHVKLLKRLKQVALEEPLDYKKLLDKPFETLNAVIDDSTLQFFSKNATNLSSLLADKTLKLTPSRMHSIFYLKKFRLWIENSALAYQVNELFDNLKDYLKKITNEQDCMALIYEVVSGEKTINSLNLMQRKEFLKRYLRLFKKNNANNNNSGDAAKAASIQFSYEDVYNYLLKIQEHLKLIENVHSLLTVNQINEDSSASLEEYKLAIDVELSKLIDPTSTVDVIAFTQLEDTFIDLAFDGFDLEKLNQLIGLVKQEKLTMKGLIKNYFDKIFGLIEKKKAENVKILNKFLKILSSYVDRKTKSSFITQDDVMEYVRLFCNNTKIELSIRLNLLEYIQTLFTSINPNDLLLLILYKTNAVLETHNLSVGSVSFEQISSERERLMVFHEIHKPIKSQAEAVGLIDLLKIWPAFESILEINSKPWNLALVKLIKFSSFTHESSDNFDLVQLVRDLKRDNKLNGYDVANISNEILTEVKADEPSPSGKNNYKLFQCFKLCFLYQNYVLINQLLLNINFDKYGHNSSVFKESNLHSLLFNGGSVAEEKENVKQFLKFIDTPMYNLFTDYLINNESKERINMVIEILKDANHQIEAAFLFTNLNNTYSQYNTLALSLVLLKKHFN